MFVRDVFNMRTAFFMRLSSGCKLLCLGLVLSCFLPVSAFAGIADEVPVPVEANDLLAEPAMVSEKTEETEEMIKVAVMPVQVEENAAGQVPNLVDDYLLTAVQDLGGHEVIGQDDIEAVLGLEKQKGLLGCTKTNCFSELSGALGVEKLVLMRIGLIEADNKRTEWVVTLKLIDIRTAVVEARSSEFIAGSAKVLLKSLPMIVDKLFKKGGMSTMGASKNRRGITKKQGGQDKGISSADAPNWIFDFSYLAKEKKYKGTLIMGGAAVVSALALIAMYYAPITEEDQKCEVCAPLQLVGGLSVNTVALLASFVGAHIYLSGRAVKTTNRSDAVGFSDTFSLLGVAVSFLGTVASFTTIEHIDPKYAPGLATATAALGMGFFAAASVSSVARTAKGDRLLAIGPTLLPGRKKQVPGMALAMRF
jgi:hypothetical protein